jgi:hypothetical protein
VNFTTRQKWLRRKRRIAKRLRPRKFNQQAKPIFAARNIRYDLADRARAIAYGGIGSIHLLARTTGLIQALDRDVRLLKVHLPYHESDHVLNIAFNILCGGDCLEDLERLRSDEAYLDALGASRIPDPTTAGDFCRRFESAQTVRTLMEAINTARLGVWKQQPREFFDRAVIDVDGTIAPTAGQCKAGMDISYDGQWGYHPLLVSLANTKEPLYLHNRAANRPSHEDAAEYLERAIVLCRQAGFRSIRLRGDTDFSQTAYLDGWDDLNHEPNHPLVRFLFGIDAMPNLVKKAEDLKESAWTPLRRPARYHVATQPRAKPDNVKQQIIEQRGFKQLRLSGEHVAEIHYCPGHCDRAYRLIITRKLIDVNDGQGKLWQEHRYFFYITNDGEAPAAELVLEANGRCDQENVIAQLKNGVHAMRLPVHDLFSNWAYMVMASLAWTLKAWWGLMLPQGAGRGRETRRQQKHEIVRMEFKRFAASVMRLPCQIIKSGRRLTYRFLSYSPWQEPMLAGVAAWRTRTQC